MKEKFFECVKSYATNENLVVMQGDIVKFIGQEENFIYLEGYKGWCEEIEITLIPKKIAEHFKIIL